MLEAMRMSFAFPDRNVLIVDLKPRVYFPDFTTRARRALTFSVVFFFDLTIIACRSAGDARECARSERRRRNSGQVEVGLSTEETLVPIAQRASRRRPQRRPSYTCMR